MCAHRDLSGALFRIAAREPLKRLRFSFTISLFALAPLVSLTVGCASTGGHFPLRPPIWRDPDMHPFNAACRPDPDPPKDQPKHQLCLPETYESPLMWDAANNTVFRPIARFFATDPGGEAVNVNSVDEVPDSSWFVNRIGRRPMSVAEFTRGYCDERELDPNAPDGAWLIDQGKPNGANPGFRIRVEGAGKFMLKADPPAQPERATGATAIAARLYYAAGFWAPCDSVVYFRPSILKLKPGLTSEDNTGETKPFDQAALDQLLANASRRGGLIRMVASKWLPGRAIGPFRYEGVRSDDPNDVIRHEDRRDLRGAKLLAAWLNHFDSREQNTMNAWMALDDRDPDSSPGYIRHFYIDLGDCFGSEWDWEGISKRLGHAYYLDFGYVFEDYVTLGIIERPWDRARRSAQGDIFGFFSSRDFRADEWRGGYPNPAFGRMTEHDGAWMARIIARFGEPHLQAAVAVGNYTEPRHRAFLLHHLRERQRLLLRRYLARLSPLTDLKIEGSDRLCGVDLARVTGVFAEVKFDYRARGYEGPRAVASARAFHARATGVAEFCVGLPHIAPDRGSPDGDLSRYLVIDVWNGQAAAPVRAHLYDLGPQRGYRLAGVERPDDGSRPSL